jgi:hypothetical protein
MPQMNHILLSDNNHEIATQLVEGVFSSPDPKLTAITLVHAMIDHPWLDVLMHNELIQAAGSTLNLRVLADED